MCQAGYPVIWQQKQPPNIIYNTWLPLLRQRDRRRRNMKERAASDKYFYCTQPHVPGSPLQGALFYYSCLLLFLSLLSITPDILFIYGMPQVCPIYSIYSIQRKINLLCESFLFKNSYLNI